MNKKEIADVLNKTAFDKISTILGVEESLVFQGIQEETHDHYVELLISEEDYRKFEICPGLMTRSNLIIYDGMIVDDTIGYTATVRDGLEATDCIDNINVLKVEECIDMIKDKNNPDEDLLNSIRKYYVKKFENVNKLLKSISDALSKTY